MKAMPTLSSKRNMYLSTICSCLMIQNAMSFSKNPNRIHVLKRNIAFRRSSIPEKKRDTKLRDSLLLDLSTIPKSIEGAYSYALANYQVETQSVSTGLLSGVGDTIAQLTEQNGKKVSNEGESKISLKELKMQRTLNFVIKGLGAGVIWHVWYDIAESCSNYAFGMDHETTFIQRTILAILMEQFIACPIVYALWDIPVPAILNGSMINSIPDRVRTKIGDLLFSNAKVWTFANAIIYNIPIEWRVLAMNLADLGWQVVMSKSLMDDKESNLDCIGETKK